jgi:hypothetical protein
LHIDRTREAGAAEAAKAERKEEKDASKNNKAASNYDNQC